MSMHMMNSDEDTLIFVACGILIAMLIATILASASLWLCKCCERRKKSYNHTNQYSLSMRNGCNFAHSQGSYVGNDLTAQLSPTIRVTSSSRTLLNRSASFEVLGASPRMDERCVAVGNGVGLPDRLVGPTHASGGKRRPIASLLGSLRRALRPSARVQPTADRQPADLDVESSTDTMLARFDSLVLSVQWSDLTTESESNVHADVATETMAVIELVNKQGVAQDGGRCRTSSVFYTPSEKPHKMAACDSGPDSPDVFSVKSFNSDRSFFSVWSDSGRQSYFGSTTELFRSCSCDEVPQSTRRL